MHTRTLYLRLTCAKSAVFRPNLTEIVPCVFQEEEDFDDTASWQSWRSALSSGSTVDPVDRATNWASNSFFWGGNTLW